MGTRVFVGGLTYRVRERDLEKFFRKYGRIKEVAMKNGFAFVEFDDYRDADDAVYELNGKELLGERVVVEHARGNSSRRGYGGRDDYSRRRSKVSVEKARGTPRGGDHMGRGSSRGSSSVPPRQRSRARDTDVRIQDRYGPPTRTDYRLVVENLSSRVSWQDLKDYMRQAGEVTYADAHKQRRNEGVVEFATSSDMRNAIDKLDDTDLSGRRIRLIEDNRRSGGGGGGGGGGRRRSRSSSSRSRSRSRRKTRSRTRSRSSRSRSRSRSKSRARTKSKSRSRSKSRHAASRSKSKSRGPTKSRSRSRSRSASKSKINGVAAKEHTSRSRSVSKGPSKSKSKSRSVSKSPRNKDEDDVKDSPMRDDDDNKDD